MTSTKHMVINTRERAVSGDINRLQTFIGADVADALRYLLIAQSSEYEAGGLATVEATKTTPLTGIVLGGMMCQPAIGGTAATVSAGVAVIVDPTGDTGDDTPPKLVRGDIDTGSITFLLNAGPGDRIDVVEMSASFTVLETANRDVYNPATGLFVATLVDKVAAFKPTYRIRRGTPGAGYPGNAAGWLPIMVARVPTTATNWDGCTCWDVRPLLADIELGGFAHAHSSSPNNDDRLISKYVTGDAGTPRVVGKITRRFQRWLAGGITPLSGIPLATRRASAGYVPAELWYLYALFPHNLPRWCEYTPATDGVRKPGGMRGLIVNATVDPDPETGGPSGPVNFPTVTGLTGTTTSGVLLCAGRYFVQENAITVVGDLTKTRVQAGALTGTVAAPNIDFDLSTGSGFWPDSAKSILARVTIDITIAGAQEGDVLVAASVSNNPTDASPFNAQNSPLIHTERYHFKESIAGAYSHYFDIEIPLPVMFPSTEDEKLRLAVTYGMTATLTAASLDVFGWRS